jgi:hypothetical protein
MLELTSTQLKGQINSNSSLKEIVAFLTKNNFSVSQKKLIQILFKETKSNNFTVNIKQESLARL